MPTVRLTRRYRFSASHRLHVPSLSEEENQRLFGKCNNPYGHGHNYLLDITVEGAVNPETGMAVEPAALDAIVDSEVVRVYDHKYLNHDVADFASDPATTENMAAHIRERLRAAWPARFPALVHIGIQETKRNRVELPVIEGIS